MLEKIRSIWVIGVILIQKIFDIIYRHITGIPSMKRSQITADLFLGGQYNLIGLKRLKQLGITAIVNMRQHPIYSEAQYEGFRYLHLPTIDNTPPSMQDLIRGAEFVDKEIKSKGKVYIHCRQGLGRGPSMAIAYLIKVGTTYEDAFSLVKSVRTFIAPRVQQIARLRELEEYYKKNNKLSSVSAEH